MHLPEFQAFADALRGMDRRNAAELKQHMARARALRDACREHELPELAYCMNAVGNLLAAMTAPGEFIDAGTLQSALIRLVDSVEKSLERMPASLGKAQDPGAALPADAPAAEQEATLTEPGTPRIEVLFDIDAVQEAAAPQPKPTPAVAPRPQEPRATAKPASSPKSKAPGAQQAQQHKREAKQAEDTLLGKVLIELEQIDQADLMEALELHRSSKLPIGECLLLKGHVEPEKIMEALRLQGRLRAELQGEDQGQAAAVSRSGDGRAAHGKVSPPVRRAPVEMHVTKQMFLGEVFLGADMITIEQLEKAMHLHQLKGLRVGQALLQIKAIDEAQLERGLELQKRLRAVALHSSADAKARVRGG